MDVVAKRDRDPGGRPDDHQERQPPRSLDAEKVIDRDRAGPGEDQRRRDREVRERELGATLIDPSSHLRYATLCRSTNSASREA